MAKDVVATCSECGKKNRIPESKVGDDPKCGECGATLEVSAPEAGKKPLEATDANFEQEVLQSSVPVLVDFWAPWCGPCRMVGPIIEELAAKGNGSYRVAKLNVDENQRTAAQYGVRSIPTMILFKDGKQFDKKIGALPKGAIESWLKSAA